MKQTTALKLTAITGAMAVGFGAFGAHALESFLSGQGRTGVWETAVLYHLIHAVVLLVLVTRERWRSGPWTCFATGILIFSGSLYLLCLTQTPWLGAITPIGGVLLMVGWLWLAFDTKR